MRHVVPLVSSLALIAAAGCASGGSSATTDAVPAGTMRLAGLIQPVGSSLTGEVSIVPTERPGESRVRLTLRGSSAGQQLAWHIHTGSCHATGPILGSSVAYSTLQIRGDGNVDLNQTIRQRLEPGHSYYVDIHPSRADGERMIGCADLVRAAE